MSKHPQPLISFVFPAQAGPEKAVRVLADANSAVAAAMSRRRMAAAGAARVLLVFAIPSSGPA